MAFWKTLNRAKILWPLVALGVLLLFNLFFTPHFFRIELKSGHLFGNLIDIIKNAAPIMLLAIGLTLVIATHGIDISVGSVVAISAGVVAILIGGDLAGHPKYPIAVAMIAALLVCTVAGHVERDAGLADRHAADHRDADPFRRGPRYCDGIHERHDHLAVRETIRDPGPGLHVRPAILHLHRGGHPAADVHLHAGGPRLGLFIEAVGINPTAARFSGINSREHHLLGLHIQRVLRGSRPA